MTYEENPAWNHFTKGGSVDGMERFCSDGTTLDVLRYRDPDKWCWMGRTWDDKAGQYSISASYDIIAQYATKISERNLMQLWNLLATDIADVAADKDHVYIIDGATEATDRKSEMRFSMGFWDSEEDVRSYLADPGTNLPEDICNICGLDEGLTVYTWISKISNIGDVPYLTVQEELGTVVL